MLLRHFYDPKLAQASWLIGCNQTGEGIVIDANRDVDQYIRLAAAEGVRITHVTETHIHADYVSGSRELARRTGARLFLSAEGGADWQYRFAEQDGAWLLRDGDVITVGNVRIETLHTPGHTPEHLAFLVTDTATTDNPVGIVTGDLLFAGDVGRPDLLERAAQMADTMVDAAHVLFRSLQRIRALPDWLQVWPGHGAGSACGKSLGAIPQTTIGYEKMTNWGLAETHEETFVQMVLAGQPEPPRYFAEMKRINRDGPRLLGGFARPPRLDAASLANRLEGGLLVVDTRPADAFAREHVPGTISLPYTRSFTTWAGWLLPYDRELALMVDEREPMMLDQIVRDLALIGLDDVAGWYDASVRAAWRGAGRELQRTQQISVDALAPRLERGEVTVLDVRGRSEWEAGHLPGAANIPLGYLEEHVNGLPRDRELVLQCQSGGRSSIATALLQAHGFTNVMNLSGGITAWRAGGRPVECEAAEPVVSSSEPARR